MKADFWLPEPYSNMAAFVAASQSIIGAVLNTLVIISLIRNPELRKGYLTPLIVSIAVTDLLFSVIACPVLAMFLSVRDMPLPNGC